MNLQLSTICITGGSSIKGCFILSYVLCILRGSRLLKVNASLLMRWDVITSCGATRHEDRGNYDAISRINSLFASHILEIKPTGTVIFPSKLYCRYNTN